MSIDRISKTFINFQSANKRKPADATTMALGEEGGCKTPNTPQEKNDVKQETSKELKEDTVKKQFNPPYVATTMALGEEGGENFNEKI